MSPRIVGGCPRGLSWPPIASRGLPFAFAFALRCETCLRSSATVFLDPHIQTQFLQVGPPKSPELVQLPGRHVHVPAKEERKKSSDSIWLSQNKGLQSTDRHRDTQRQRERESHTVTDTDRCRQRQTDRQTQVQVQIQSQSESAAVDPACKQACLHAGSGERFAIDSSCRSSTHTTSCRCFLCL